MIDMINIHMDVKISVCKNTYIQKCVLIPNDGHDYFFDYESHKN